LSKLLNRWTVPSSLAVLFFSAVSTPAAAADDDDVEITAEPSKAGPKPAAPATATPATTSPTTPTTTVAPTSTPDVEALRAEVRAMRAEIDAHNAADQAKAHDEPPAASVQGTALGHGLSITGYLQSQYESHQDSENELRQGGALLNQDRFLVRRARIRLVGDWQYAAAMIELDGNTVRGFGFGLQKAEATLHYRPDPQKLPIVQGTLGLFDTPFGYELTESPRQRPFMERSQASRAFWPGEPDLGMRISGGYGVLRYSAAALNGHPIGDKQYPGQDPISAKDVAFRFGVDGNPHPDVRVAGGVSALRGRGFHAGTDAAKGTVQWHDLNEDGVVQAYELQAIPATSATPSQTFEHWAIGADLQLQYASRLGKTKLYGELVIGQNMDRALFVADPVLTSVDSRELGFYVGVTQEITKYAIVGFRYDYYDPNADVLDKRGGKLLPYTQRMKTYSPMVGLVLPDRARLVFQYDIVQDFLARDLTGVPANLKNDAWTLRLQVEL
jgi:hypothetical protein